MAIPLEGARPSRAHGAASASSDHATRVAFIVLMSLIVLGTAAVGWAVLTM